MRGARGVSHQMAMYNDAFVARQTTSKFQNKEALTLESVYLLLRVQVTFYDVLG